MTVIEVDGVIHEELEVDQIQIFAGQRYSVILNADRATDNYWIRANPSTGTTGFKVTATNPLVEEDLVPLENPGTPGNPEVGGVDVALNLDMTFVDLENFSTGSNSHPCSLALGKRSSIIDLESRSRVETIMTSFTASSDKRITKAALPREAMALYPSEGTTTSSIRLTCSLFRQTGTFQINDESFIPPTVPVLLQILSGAQSADSLLPSGSLYSLPLNSTVEPLPQYPPSPFFSLF
ncbi:hypothetical protein D9758_013747 [Tetrapyrgos nigripes]|uniref:Plastocyanin-like domain-containing protein n=1 Tax=Tetrapyrgos nigripes TaxID=182062 RepID=A0A8H5G1R3_9AGAR|nr:hypothetical protein D9758_013747 [Tetrapyrgos nigripes]